MLITLDSELAGTLQATLEASRIALEKVQQMGTGNEPYTIAESAAYLKVARSTLSEYIRSGEITPSEYGSRVWIVRSELDGFLKRHRRKSSKH